MSVSEATSPTVDTSTSSTDAHMVWFLGEQTWLRATSDQTEGTLGLVEHRLNPGFASPYHRHQREDESFYVIDGELRFVSDGVSQIVGAGGFVFLPRNIPHGFCVHGDQSARVLLLATPGTFEGFVADLSSPEPPAGPPDMDVLMETAARYGIDILGPLPN